MTLRSMRRARAGAASCAASLVLGSVPAFAAEAEAGEGAIEEIVVTGSYIRGTPEDAASPVTVMSREEMNYTGNPSVFEMIRNLGPVTGIDGETNQFQSNGLEGSANINLRGLGPGRTLVLLNGKRIVPNPLAVGESGQQFVNINQIPSIALERVELLKDGASATYGSDAIAGVANFITRSDYRGLELRGSYTDIEESDGDYEANAIFGFGTDRLDVVASVGYQFQSEIRSRDIDFINEMEPVISRRGYSTIPNPVRLINVVPGAAIPVANDPDCEAVGGQIDAAGACNFRFTPFDNLAEEEEHYQAFVETTYALSETFELTGSALYAVDEVPEWKTSPSYPPQTVVDPTRFIGPGVPSWDDFVTRHPEIGAAFPAGALVLGRTFGVAGPADEGYREIDTIRLNAGVSGDLPNGILMDASVTWGRSQREAGSPDTRIDNLAFAYQGLIGPNCDPATGVPGSGNQGTGDCYYYNPFTSGYRVSQAPGFEGVQTPGFTGDETLLNHPDMQDWLTELLGSDTETSLTVFDLVFSGESGVDAGGGTVGWAAGMQWRHDELDVDPFENTDLTQTPCAFGLEPGQTHPVFTSYTCAAVPTGAFHFLAGALPEQDSQDVWAVFGEVIIPLTERMELQLATRYENYSGDVGDTLDPKAALRWDVTDQISLRGSVTTSFRGPTLNQLGGRGTTLQFVAPTGAFKAIDTVGNPELGPEQALTTNLGIVVQPTDDVFMSLDYWRFAFEEPIVIEPFNSVIELSTSSDPELREFAQSKIDYIPGQEGDPSALQRVTVTYTNGPEIITDGFDYKLQWDIPSDAGLFTVGTEGTYINKYDVGDWLYADGFDAAGRLNRETFVRSMPEWKNDLWVNWSLGGHNVRADVYYTGEYEDTGAPAGFEQTIDDHVTLDLHYNFYFNEDLTRVFASIYNVTDEDPPAVLHELDYDPYTHNPFGRMIKVGVQHDFGGLFR